MVTKYCYKNTYYDCSEWINLSRFTKRKDCLQSVEQIEIPYSVRATLNRVESLSVFIDDFSRDLLVYVQIMDVVRGAAYAN